ncbi:MAG: aminopeptidase P N-terminal domain-containing protein [Deltaproteobacteria bacterium]|nr:aminopeptidase P N-terminal domain-containing protein [Deltaproteobacteria bacterium]
MNDEFRQRRERLMERVGHGVAIFRSAPVAVMHNDVEYPYRQDSDFLYLTGLNEPEAVAVLTPYHDKHRFILFIRPKNPDQEVWTGMRLSREEARDTFGADEVYLIADLDETLPQYLENADTIYYRFGRDNSFNGRVIKFWQQLMTSYPRRGRGPIAIRDTGVILHPLRMVKSEAEINLMCKAAAISVEAHKRACKKVKPGRYEYEVQAEIEYVFRQQGADGPAYPTIAASGSRGCILHYTDNSQRLQKNELLLIDAGCSYHSYNADITRTIPVSGKFTIEQKILYELVLEAQRQAISRIRPANSYTEISEIAVKVITEGLAELGLLTGEFEELIKGEQYKPFFMHRIGHWIGMDVHDVGIYQNGDSPQMFLPGNVLTVEPGIYIGPNIQPVEGQPEVDQRWRGIGIRIEDVVLVTPDGNEVLTAGLPKAVREIERR